MSKRRWAAVACALAQVALAGSASAGQQAAIGPVIGYVPSRGVSFGWEAGGGRVVRTGGPYHAFPWDFDFILHANVGMSWRPGSAGSASRELVSYLAWEPWILLGGPTLGLAYSTETSVFPLGGLWAASPLTSFNGLCSPCYTISIAIGWRWSRIGEFYLTPKVGFINNVDFYASGD